MTGPGATSRLGDFHSDFLFREKTSAVRACIWLYIILWLVEGALRKWLVPGLSSYVLFIREPIVLTAYALAVSRRVFPMNGFVIVIGILSFMGFMSSLMQAQVNLVVTLYGARSYFLHFPLIFLIGHVMNRDDVEKLGRMFLYTAPPLALLMTMQFVSSPSSSLNNGAGGSIGGQMIGAMGHARPSATFSFANGIPLYLSLLMAFTVHGYTRGELYPKWVLWGALGSVLIGTVVSVSRNAVVSVLLVVVAFVVMGVFYPTYVRKFVGLGVVVIVLGGLLSMLPVFSSGMDSLQSRFQDGGAISSSIGGRFFGDLVNPWNSFLDVDVFGMGMGRATNAAQLYTGNSDMLIENEWLRTLYEMGWVVGTAFLAMRVVISCWLLWRAHLALLEGNALSGLILSSCIVSILMTPLGLTTGQGFLSFAAGLCLAAENGPASEGGRPASPSSAPASARPRGRSLYAERLHGNGRG